jgi:hypothetical protein
MWSDPLRTTIVIAAPCGRGVHRNRSQKPSVINLDDVDRQSVDPSVALGERRRSSNHNGGAIGLHPARSWCIRSAERPIVN